MPDPSPKRPRRSFWGWCRCSFRWCRIALLALVLFVLGLLTWLRLVGLPDFLRTRIVDELASRGVIADFSSLRFHWFRGLVASDLRIAWGGTNGPRVAIEEADLDIAPPPWHERGEIVRGIAVRRGSLSFPLLVPDEPPVELRIDQVAADLRFLPGDAWEVRRLAAQALGLGVELQATITNLAALRASRRPPSPDPAAAAQRVRLLRSLIEELSHWDASRPPRLAINLHLDGARPAAADGDLYFEVPEVRTPRGDLRQLRLSLRIPPPAPDATNAGAHAYGTLELAGVQTAHGGLDNLTGRLEFNGPPRPALPTNATWSLAIEHVFLRGLRARQVALRGTNDSLATPTGATRADLAAIPVATRLAIHAELLETSPRPGEPLTIEDVNAALEARHHVSTNLPDSLRLSARARHAVGAPGRLGPLQLELSGVRRDADAPAPPPDLGPWAWLWPYAADIHLDLESLQSPKLAVERVDLDLDWQPPRLGIRRLDANLFRGTLKSHGELDVLTRAVTLDAETTCDLHGVDLLLGPKSRENFVRYQWKEPPSFQGHVGATLPAWTNRQPDWNGTVKPTVRLDGRFRVGAGGFKGVPFDRAESSLSYDGANWRLPDLRTARPEGQQEIAVDYNEDTREYRVDARGHVHPPILRPLIGEQSAQVLDLFEFKDAVGAVVSVWGPWTEGNRSAIVGTVHATNFLFRGQRFDRVDAEVVYTNRFLIGAPVHLRRDAAELRVEGVGYSFPEDQLWLTNAVNSIEPAVVAAAISPGFPEKLVHYRFDSPPVVRAQGTVRPRQTESARMTFDIEGGPFHFWRLSSEHLRTRLLWEGTSLVLTNIDASFYRGTLTGRAVFDLSRPDDGRYHFEAAVRQAALGELLHEATLGRTNVAQGTFDLDLRIDQARTADIWSWNGAGRAELRDGLLWDAPIFGFVSPALNAVVPGLGNNRARRADATFTITNGVIHTRDLVIACPPAKLLYRGSLDFDQRVDAKVEGQVLGDIAGVGPLFGLILRPLTKLLEFRVTGTLADVQAEPLYVLPKLIFLPLQPFKALFNMIPGTPKAEASPPTKDTNAPAAAAAPVPAPGVMVPDRPPNPTNAPPQPAAPVP